MTDEKKKKDKIQIPWLHKQERASVSALHLHPAAAAAGTYIHTHLCSLCRQRAVEISARRVSRKACVRIYLGFPPPPSAHCIYDDTRRRRVHGIALPV